MATETRQLHIIFFPLMAHGHMIPTLDIARVFAAHGVATAIITTPRNAAFFTNPLKNSPQFSTKIEVKTVPFPSVEAGLPSGFENLDSAKSPEDSKNFFKATSMLGESLEQILRDYHSHPTFLVADMFFPWAVDAALKFGIPSLIFHGMSFFSLCVTNSLRSYEPYKTIESDSEPFVIPNLPDEIVLTRNQLPDNIRENAQTDITKLLDKLGGAERKSYGVIVNSFYELESAYAHHYRNVLGMKAWPIGPLSLWKFNNQDKAQRGKTASVNEKECLKWLDSKTPNSVIYVCFGSVVKFTPPQLFELAMGLENSGQQFIWVVRKGEEETEDWLPEGYEKRNEGKGLIIRGWAPQVVILEHEAIGGFVTHCGWNSALEGVSAGVPMVTWPVFAEQFHNEKLVSQVLRTGVEVGAKKWIRTVGDSVKREAIEKAVRRVLVGEEAEEMRSRAKKLGEMAKRAVQEGGSSYSNLSALIEELGSYPG